MAEMGFQRIKSGVPIFTLLTLCVSVLSFVSPEIASLFIFDRNAVAQGEAWRLVSSHYVHFTGTHLAYNLLAFCAAGWIVERKNCFHFAILYVLMALVISISLFFLKPAMSHYGGLSGMACGFILYCALVKAGEPGPWRNISQMIIICLPIKITIEAYNSASILPYWGHQTFVIMPISHVTGITVALLFYLIVKNVERYSNNRFNIDVRPSACRQVNRVL